MTYAISCSFFRQARSSRFFSSKKWTSWINNTLEKWNVPFCNFDMNARDYFFGFLFFVILLNGHFRSEKSFLENDRVDKRNKVCSVSAEVMRNSWKSEFAFRWILIIPFRANFYDVAPIFFFWFLLVVVCLRLVCSPISIKWLMLLFWQAIKTRQLDCSES